MNHNNSNTNTNTNLINPSTRKFVSLFNSWSEQIKKEPHAAMLVAITAGAIGMFGYYAVVGPTLDIEVPVRLERPSNDNDSEE